MREISKYFLQPGFIFVSEEPHLVHTVLGSCVSVCLWDSLKKFGGMNHYIYSAARDNLYNGRYGDVSIPYMLSLMLEMGSNISCLKAHIIGGGQNPQLDSNIGEDNVAIAEKVLIKNNIEIFTRDVGGQIGRKVIFDTEKGEVLVYKVLSVRKNDWW